MKTICMKLFLVMAALVCMLEGLVLVDVGLGRIPPDRAVALYVRLFQIPHGLKTVLVSGLLFIILGFILIIVASRTKPAVRMIELERGGKVLHIPYTTIKDFIEQIIGQNPYMNNINVEFESRGKGIIDIRIVSGFRDVPSIHRELTLVEETLRSEIERVFEWKDFAFHFQLGEVSVNSQKKYFTDGKAPEAPEQPVPIEKQPIAPPEIEQKEEAPTEADIEKSEDAPKARSIFSAMLWGKKAQKE